MHVLGFSFDLSLLLQFVATAVLLLLGLVHLVKSTASRYFVVDGKFGGDSVEDCRRSQMRSGGPTATVAGMACIVCGESGGMQCSGCKAVRYCSTVCQSRDWRSGHKNKCRDMKFVDSVNSTKSAKRRTGLVDNPSGSSPFLTARGSCKELKQPLKVLFPYDEFVKLFNWDNPGFPPCGLLNCGNSCFANVVLQCLACTKPLVAYLLEKGHSRECCRNDWCFFCELQQHIQRASQSLHPFSPLNILSRLPSIGGNLGCGKQEDAHEFMRFAIDTMQSICLEEFGGEKSLEPSTQETTLIQHIFGGYLQSEVICTKCDKISYRYENMMDLTVEIQGDAASLQDCLEQFTVKEWLDGENMYKCDGCNDYVKAWKRLTVHQAPNILTIALKRFQSGRFGKLNKRVAFPELLDLGPYMSEARKSTDLYRLYAVVVHVDMLNASFFGHYICYTKDFRGNWYRIDDCKVMKVELEEVLSQGAYMLLYSRVCVRQPCLKPLELAGKEKEQKSLQPDQEAKHSLIKSVVPAGLSASVNSVSSLKCVVSEGGKQCKQIESTTRSGPKLEVEEPVYMDTSSRDVSVKEDQPDQEADQSSIKSVETAGVPTSVNSVSTLKCITSEDGSQCKQTKSTIGSGPKLVVEEPVCMDLDTSSGGVAIKEDPKIAATLSPEVTSGQLEDAKEGIDNLCSHLEDMPSVEVVHSEVTDLKEVSLIGANTTESEQPSISRHLDPDCLKSISSRNYGVRNSLLEEFSTDSHLTCETPETSPSGSVLGLNLVPYSQDQGNICFPSDHMECSAKEADTSGNPLFSQQGSELPIYSNSGATFKPLFTAGFLDQPARRTKLAKLKLAQPEPVDLGGLNGFAERFFPCQNCINCSEILNKEDTKRKQNGWTNRDMPSLCGCKPYTDGPERH
ncbi:ubiquitin carboxyl-terminal hydrolase 18-like [Aristolochia californica]|uniref:ubiquitin carboxyl-terminal hydrolase 18-like n=1 Tax=Aristolochia californica TaxID=171875 RepID=UPI0035E0CC68